METEHDLSYSLKLGVFMSNIQHTSNPELESQLDALADLCCDALQGETSLLIGRGEALLKSILMSGYVRKEGRTLAVEIETRVKDRCRDASFHRGGELASMAKHLQDRFDDLILWHARRPEEEKYPREQSPPKAADYSASSDA
jgi:hypothetical protein